ncbi:MAG TPA: carboxypeptidase regulatory-like domain-containing protein [Candidatus Sulfotelmatobacter sp.]|nr:carboxypeptidase regulatory-like domain-containing protein [Candidatus Sulfotelmatobacter sp.]
MNQAHTSGTVVGTAALGCPVEHNSTAFAVSKQLPGCPRPYSRGRLSPNICRATLGLFVALLLSAVASAQTLTGVVKNSTTGKPGAGDEVVLLSLGQGMEESGRTKADAKGHFSLKLDDAQSPHLVRVIHQGVTYHRMAPPGTTSVEVEVYDVAKKVEGIQVVADIMRFQAAQGQLQVERTFAVQNSSKPPRTQMNEHNLEFYVPDGAQIGEGQAMTAGGQPVKSAPVPEGDNAKNRYAFLFPLRPGETRFNVVYNVPYTGSANIDPKSVYPLEHFVAIAPKSMTFEPAPGAVYQSTPFPGQPDANVEVASNTQLGQSMAFKLNGEGTLQAQGDEGGQSGQGASEQSESRPGGGLGPPIDAPDPLQKYRWWILAGIAAALGIGGVIIASRQQAANRAARAGAGFSAMREDDDFAIAEPHARPRASEPRPQPAAGSSMLLQALKDELFDLEVEHKQGLISQQEYEKAKAALDQTLQRALKRESQKSLK